MSYAADFLLIHFHPDHGGKGCCTTVADIPRGWPRSLKRQALEAIAEHANWLQSSDGKGTKAAKREAMLTTFYTQFQKDEDYARKIRDTFVPSFAHNVINPHD